MRSPCGMPGSISVSRRGEPLRVRRPSGRKRIQLLVASGVGTAGTCQLLAVTRSQGESQAAWEGLLNDLYRRRLAGTRLALVVTDGCAGLAAALPTVYPRVPHQRCWVHKLRNVLAAVRRADHVVVKVDAQAIYRAPRGGRLRRPPGSLSVAGLSPIRAWSVA